MHETRKQLFHDNLELVTEVAGRYEERGTEYVDLIWAGTQGLHEAAEKFDFYGRYSFKYFAMYFIRKHIQKEMGK